MQLAIRRDRKRFGRVHHVARSRRTVEGQQHAAVFITRCAAHDQHGTARIADDAFGERALHRVGNRIVMVRADHDESGATGARNFRYHLRGPATSNDELDGRGRRGGRERARRELALSRRCSSVPSLGLARRHHVQQGQAARRAFRATGGRARSPASLFGSRSVAHRIFMGLLTRSMRRRRSPPGITPFDFVAFAETQQCRAERRQHGNAAELRAGLATDTRA